MKTTESLAPALFLLTDADLALRRFHLLPGLPIKARGGVLEVAVDVRVLRQYGDDRSVTRSARVLDAVSLRVWNRHTFSI